MSAPRVTAYIGIGSNLGDAKRNVQRAIVQLDKLAATSLSAQSSLFRSAPIDATGDDYINAVARIETGLAPDELLAALQALENEAGRERPYPNAPRTLDLDILLYGQQNISTSALTVPHPRMTQRAFVLIPLLQIDALISIPTLGAAHEFVPVGFDPPTSLTTDQFHLEPLGPQHNQADHAAWMSSIEHIRSTPGYSDGSWPPVSGMTLEENLADLRRHADDFTRGAGFTFTVLEPSDGDVIGCVYLYPSASQEWEVRVHSWVRADRSGLDVPLADCVARWLATDWPWERVDRCGR